MLLHDAELQLQPIRAKSNFGGFFFFSYVRPVHRHVVLWYLHCFDLVIMHNGLESGVLSHLWNRKLIPGLMIPLFSFHLMKLHLKYGFPISLKWHKSALRQNGYIILTLALHVLIQASLSECFLNYYFLFIKKFWIQIISPNLFILCVFINTYTNRKEGKVAGRKLWSEHHSTRNISQPEGWVTTLWGMQPFLGCSTKVVKK